MRASLLPESQALLREARQALRAAELLRDEEMYGDSIARAYYAMYYAARALLAEKGIFPKTHRGVHRALGLHPTSTALLPRELVQNFAMAQESRQRAD